MNNPVTPTACNKPRGRGPHQGGRDLKECVSLRSDPRGCSAGARACGDASSDACDVTGAVHGHHIGACTAEDPTSIGLSGCQRAHPSRAERQPAQPAPTACRGRAIYARLWRHSFQQPSRPLTQGRQLLPSPVPSHGMHVVTSEFMRSTHVPQVLTTTSLIVGRLLDDAAGDRARRAGSTGCSGSSRQRQRTRARARRAQITRWHTPPRARPADGTRRRRRRRRTRSSRRTRTPTTRRRRPSTWGSSSSRCATWTLARC